MAHEFVGQGYLKTTRLLKEGGKTVTFEFPASVAVEAAKLELMGRDLQSFLPTLLEIKVTLIEDSKGTGYKQDTGRSDL